MKYLALLATFVLTPVAKKTEPVRIVQTLRWKANDHGQVKEKIIIQNDLFQIANVDLDCSPFENESVQVFPRSRDEFWLMFPAEPVRLPGCKISKVTPQ